MDYDEELHAAWVKRAMELSHEVALAYSGLESDGENDHMREWHDARKALRAHLMNQPASMALTDPELRAGIELQKREIERLREVCDDLYSDLLAAGSLAPQDSGAYALIQESIRLRRDRWARKQTPNA